MDLRPRKRQRVEVQAPALNITLPERATKVTKKTTKTHARGRRTRSTVVQVNSRPESREATPQANLDNEESEPENVIPTQTGLGDLPVELLHMIFSQVDPQDLVELCHVCNYFSVVLHSRDARKAVWQKSFSTIYGMFRCEEKLSEMGLAKLLFEKECFFCSRKVCKIWWEWGFKACRPCLTPMSMSVNDFKELCPGWMQTRVDDCLTVMPHVEVDKFETRVLLEDALPLLKGASLYNVWGQEWSAYLQTYGELQAHRRQTAAELKDWYTNRIERGLLVKLIDKITPPLAATAFEILAGWQVLVSKTEKLMPFVTHTTWPELRAQHVIPWWKSVLQGQYRPDYWPTIYARRVALATYVKKRQDTAEWFRPSDACFHFPEFDRVLKVSPTLNVGRKAFGRILRGDADCEGDANTIIPGMQRWEYEFSQGDVHTPRSVKNWRLKIGERCLQASDTTVLPPQATVWTKEQTLYSPLTWFRCQQPLCKSRKPMQLVDVCNHACMYEVRQTRKGKGKYPDHFPSNGNEREHRIKILEAHGPAWGDYVKKVPLLDPQAVNVAKALVNAHLILRGRNPDYDRLGRCVFASNGKDYTYDAMVPYACGRLTLEPSFCVNLIRYDDEIFRKDDQIIVHIQTVY